MILQKSDMQIIDEASFNNIFCMKYLMNKDAVSAVMLTVGFPSTPHLISLAL